MTDDGLESFCIIWRRLFGFCLWDGLRSVADMIVGSTCMVMVRVQSMDHVMYDIDQKIQNKFRACGR